MHARSRICSDLPVVLCRSGKRSLLPLPALPSSLELSSEQDASAAARLRLLPPVEEPKLRRKLGTGVLGTSGGFAHLAQWNPSFCQSIHVWELASRMGAPLLRRLPSEVCAADSLEVQRRAGCCCCCWRNRGREGREFDWSELEMLKLRVVSWRPSAWLAEPEFSPWLTELPCLLSTSRTALGSSLSVCVQWSSAEPPSLRGASTPAPSSAARFSSSPSKESTCWQSLSDFLFATRLIAAGRTTTTRSKK
mmetsp:Transcript_22444/g.52744  ORF Transcript_22444/g.52744 Transcript_22444/m.52744 type:complete len:250 (-) Transcript_22444:560-1309(-)